MKKKIVFFIALIAMLVFSFAIAACTPQATGNVVTYTVRFNNNYDGNVTKVEVEENKTIQLIESPERVGYSFVGWYLSSDVDASEKFDETKPIDKDVTVFAKWERDQSVYLVTLKYQNLRTPDSVVKVNKNTALTKPEDPVYDENDMYVFDKWYTDEHCTSEYDFSKPVADDIVLYAGWTQSKVVIKFDANYSGAPKAERVIAEIGKSVTRPADPEREMYAFMGWYTERIGGEEFDFNTPVSEQCTVYGHWLRSEYFVTFNANGATLADGIAKSYKVKRGESAVDIAAEFLTHLTYEGHEFGGWLKFKTEVDEEVSPADIVDLSEVNDDLTLYAYWTLEEYSVSFNYAYENAPANPETQTVKYGKLIKEFDVAEREGYLFLGWYVDAQYSSQFTLDTPVTGNLNLYARWMEKPIETVNVKITYTYKVGGSTVNYAVKEVELGSTAASNPVENPKVDEYYFVGWYEDEAFKTSFNMSRNLTEDITVYGKLLKRYTLEAEAVDFTGKTGQGTSTNSFEEGLIYGQSFVGDGSGNGDSYVSGGWFVRELYYNGAMLNFEVVSSVDVTDAVMYLRVSSESYKFEKTREKDGKEYNYLTDEEFKIIVNGTLDEDGKPTDWLRYGGLYIPMANLVEKEDLSPKKTPFEDCFIAVNVNLRAGSNIITLLVDNNNFKGGTFHAEAPMVDCMYIYASEAADIYVNDYEFYKKPGVTP